MAGRQLAFFLVALLACAPSVRYDELQPSAARRPEPGPIQEIPDAHFGEPERYWNVAEGRHGLSCYPLAVGKDRLAYVILYHVVDHHLFAFRCVDYDASTLPWEMEERYGGVELAPSELREGRLQPLEIPGWSLVSNPSFCGRYLAYWDLSEGAVSAALYDLLSRRVVARRATSLAFPHTDNSGHFYGPTWQPECDVAVFSDRHSEKPAAILEAP